MMRILNFGSLHTDIVYRLPHVVRPGETIAALERSVQPGGKGANQSVAVARAGGTVHHAGQIGADGDWLLEQMSAMGVDVSRVRVDDKHPTGHAVIQVEPGGENAIIVDGGANLHVALPHVGSALADFGPGDWLLVQNEVSAVPALVATAKSRGMKVCFNPAPMNERALAVPLEGIDLLVVNQTEGRLLADTESADAIVHGLHAKSGGAVILTLGALGVLHFDGRELVKSAPDPVRAVDTTAAGDTFIGYFLAGVAAGIPLAANLDRACRAAAWCCLEPGAMSAIPTAEQVDGG